MQRHNEQVRQSRQTLKRSSEAVLFLSKQELACRGHDELNDSLNKGNYRELLECFANVANFKHAELPVDQPPAVAFTAFADAWPRAIETEIGAALCAIGHGKDFDFDFLT